MSTPILAIDDSASKAKAVANLLPCKVQHDGAVDPIEAYWKPTKEDSTRESATAHERYVSRLIKGQMIPKRPTSVAASSKGKPSLYRRIIEVSS